MVGKCRQAGRERATAARKVGAPQVSNRNILLARRDAAARIPPRRASLGRTAGASRRKRTANSATALTGWVAGRRGAREGDGIREACRHVRKCGGLLREMEKADMLSGFANAVCVDKYRLLCAYYARLAVVAARPKSVVIFGGVAIHPRHSSARRQPTQTAARGRAEAPTPRGGVPEAAATKRGGSRPPRSPRGDAGAKRTPTEGEPSHASAPRWRGVVAAREGGTKALHEGRPAAAACPRGVAAGGKKRWWTRRRQGRVERGAPRSGRESDGLWAGVGGKKKR